MREIAQAIGLKGASSYQRYEDGDLFTREYLPIEMGPHLKAILVGRGAPPIEPYEVDELFGIQLRPADTADEIRAGRPFYHRRLEYDAVNKPSAEINRKFLIYIASYIDLRRELSWAKLSKRGWALCYLMIHDDLIKESEKIMSVPAEDRAKFSQELIDEDEDPTTNLPLLLTCSHMINVVRRHEEEAQEASSNA
ncbi:hypothetical protein AB4Z01_14940 [Inquilinus sp. YAF38]|uniref:hypothetical protein n=1 Tax=Inquilinus sp. YAF38 TaxID=3233084 RepID=UPI003F8EEFF4